MARARSNSISAGDSQADGGNLRAASGKDPLPMKRLVTKRELREILGIPYCQQHISRLEAAGQFPRRIRLGQNRVVWLMEEVLAWIDQRIAARNAKEDA